MPKMRPLECTQAQFEGIHRALDKARSTSKTVTVDRESLAALLRDHARLVDRFREEGP